MEKVLFSHVSVHISGGGRDTYLPVDWGGGGYLSWPGRSTYLPPDGGTYLGPGLGVLTFGRYLPGQDR